MSIDFTKLADFSYLFAIKPSGNTDFVYLLAITFGILIISSGLVWISMVRRERQLPVLSLARERIVRWLFTTGFVGLILVFFRWQSIPYFATRVLLVLWILITLTWLVSLALYLLKSFPKQRRLYEERLQRERYIPKPKK